jgi:enterobacterial common antigen flippase
MSSYRQIFKSTAIVGGAKVITLGVGLLQNKVLTLVLGPAGYGVVGQLQTLIDFVGSVAGLGLGSAGVRQIAEAAAANQEHRLASTAKTLRIAAVATGVLGMLVMLCFSEPLAIRTFKCLRDEFGINYAHAIALVSLAVLFTSVVNGQAALLQGLRRLKDLAGCQVAGALFGAAASITLVCFFGIHGVAWYLVAANAFLIAPFWWRARRLRLAPGGLSWHEFTASLRGLLGVGFAFMLTGLLSTGTLYLIPLLVRNQLDAIAVGIYVAVANISTKYIGVILQAMGADFYPRLMGVAKDHPAANRLVNEQTEIGVLIALPGVLAMIALAPWILQTLNSAKFLAGTELLRWLAMGLVFRMICWPMGFILMAKGMTVAFVLIELLFSVLQLGFLLLFMRFFNLEGIGLAFLAANLVLIAVLAWLSRRITGFCWSRKSAGLIAGVAVAMALTQCSVRLLPLLPGTLVALLITAAVSAGCLVILQKMLQFNLRESSPLNRLANLFRRSTPPSP